MRVGSIEAGGTKFVCAVGNEKLEILKETQFPTTTPIETIQNTIDFFKENPVEALSIGSFGPIEIREDHEKYGFITTTPKPNWADTNILGALQEALQIPCVFTTDVNASAYGEALAREHHSLIYFTIGTGIGGSAFFDKKFIGGVSHAEMGHVYVKRHPLDVDFEGICPYHKDCLEGLASGPSILARTGIAGEILAKENPTHQVWDILSFYIAQAAVNATLNFAPEKIVFGGSVVSHTLLQKIKQEFVQQMNGYMSVEDVENYLVLPAFEGNKSATVGNFAMALAKLKV